MPEVVSTELGVQAATTPIGRRWPGRPALSFPVDGVPLSLSVQEGVEFLQRERPTAVRELELEVVDLAGVLAVLVDQLPVEQLQPGLEDPSSHRGQPPTLVSTSNGIVATGTTWSPHDRYVSAYC